MEINSGLKDIYNGGAEEANWKHEREKLIAIIKQKNKEIKSFRQELDTLLSNLANLRLAQK